MTVRDFRVIRHNEEVRIFDDINHREMFIVSSIDETNRLMSIFYWMGIVESDPLQESIDKMKGIER